MRLRARARLWSGFCVVQCRIVRSFCCVRVLRSVACERLPRKRSQNVATNRLSKCTHTLTMLHYVELGDRERDREQCKHSFPPVCDSMLARVCKQHPLPGVDHNDTTYLSSRKHILLYISYVTHGRGGCVVLLRSCVAALYCLYACFHVDCTDVRNVQCFSAHQSKSKCIVCTYHINICILSMLSIGDLTRSRHTGRHTDTHSSLEIYTHVQARHTNGTVQMVIAGGISTHRPHYALSLYYCL